MTRSRLSCAPPPPLAAEPPEAASCTSWGCQLHSLRYASRAPDPAPSLAALCPVAVAGSACLLRPPWGIAGAVASRPRQPLQPLVPKKPKLRVRQSPNPAMLMLMNPAFTEGIRTGRLAPPERWRACVETCRCPPVLPACQAFACLELTSGSKISRAPDPFLHHLAFHHGSFLCQRLLALSRLDLLLYRPGRWS